MRRLLLISGGANPQYNYPRYAEDCYLVAETFASHGFEVSACFADGHFPGSTAPNVSRVASASRANVDAMLSEFSQATQRGDRAVIYVTDHGNVDLNKTTTNILLNLWGEVLSNHEFFSALDTADPKNTVLIFQQCFSGVFADRYKARGYEMAGASTDGPSYAAVNYGANLFTQLLCEALQRGLSLRQSVKTVASSTYRPEVAWHSNARFSRSFKLRSR